MSGTILDLLSAAHDGAAPAITAPDRLPLSYAALRALVDETAAALAGAGLARGDRVAIVLANGPALATSFLAVAASCVAAPLNPAYTTAEFEFYLSDLGARMLLVEAGSTSPAIDVARARGIEVRALVLDAERAGGFRVQDALPDTGRRTAPARPDHVALVLHTSGTTSRPKIVPLSHANLCASASHVGATLGLTPEDRCLNVMPLFHIHGLVAAILASLARGASACCAPGFRPHDFERWLVDARATWYTAVPTIQQAVLALPAPAAATSLRFIRSSSAPLPPRTMRELEDRFGVPVIEAYGMTEAAHQMASNPLPPGRRVAGSVGLPAGVEIAILDADGAVVPAGAQGEVAIRGPSVIAGYEANPEANATAFSHGFFRTGDMGRIDPDGYLFLTGRLKEIINRGGEKISPVEVDTVLLEHPAVAQAVCFAAPHATLGEDIVAAIVARPGALVSEAELRDFAAARLAAFKVPRRVLVVDEIPKGATGKLQRRALAELLARQLTESVMPRTPTEHALARLWAEVLGLKRVGIRDNFAALGGDSLRATVIEAKALEAGLALSAPMLFEHPTIEQLAQILAPREQVTSEPVPR